MPYQVIILAAGQGKRMQANQNKQFIRLKGEPVIVHTLKTFHQDNACKQIHLVINPIEQQAMQQLVENYQLTSKVNIVYGGKERQDSVYAGLLACEEQEGIVLIHDGARPFVEKHHITSLTAQAEKEGAALLAVPVTDTIKRKTEVGLTSLDRSELWAAQTPQAFQFSVIKKAHDKAREVSFIGTDDASLVERIHLPVHIVQGSYNNMKLTTPEDIEKANAILTKRNPL
ncbi:2-C-methyl-D-erythritol 4-phosphate cytidylyltransferase [Pontibacillus litoralis]|uniref:2-C-methyl-D-erythritol 4-phosphate cytidylyltransferase n=1 Tax=Pontibacillus litoralis JSM 072002 TaxID=1385512 RepID=A0A0A5HP58_9BACI|nr:2-C-methyl-D-erythritol 4-phosphate cytidylyltransferase [Pontibacillus litoralis]KGX85407.1 2-C-methyl-D-erythritol 4-phosphate cytidylyltransferase [Pontibacillus litoralis JSM 072002]